MDNVPQNAEEYRRWWAEQKPNVPYGHCWCGCGQLTPVAPQNSARKHWVRGEPVRFAAAGHHRRKYPSVYTIEPQGFATPCWTWQGYTDHNGYGALIVNGKFKYAHRHFYEQLYGPIPEDLQLDHLCRRPACCRPDHLEAVTQKENLRRGKHIRLSSKKAEHIRELVKNGASHRAVAARFGVSKSTVSAVVWRKTWT